MSGQVSLFESPRDHRAAAMAEAHRAGRFYIEPTVSLPPSQATVPARHRARTEDPRSSKLAAEEVTATGRADAEQAQVLAALRTYAARLRGVAIDSIDGAEFVDKWGQSATFVYCDPPYVAASRTGTTYAHEMTDADHRRLAAACRGAVERGAKVAVSGYASALYDELFAGWRTIEVDVPLYGARDTKGQRRTEVLWMSYDAAESFAGIEAAKRNARQPTLFDLGGGAK